MIFNEIISFYNAFEPFYLLFSQMNGNLSNITLYLHRRHNQLMNDLEGNDFCCLPVTMGTEGCEVQCPNTWVLKSNGLTLILETTASQISDFKRIK